MTEYKEMLVDTELQHGDRVTFAQSREGELLRLFASKHKDGRLGVILAEEFMDISRLLGRGLKIVQVDRPIPEPELPTVEGDYIFTTIGGFRAAYALREGVWLDPWGEKVWDEDGGGSCTWAAAQIGAGATLTRVIPADEAKHPEVDVAAAVEEFMHLFRTSKNGVDGDFEITLRRVLEGEFDL